MSGRKKPKSSKVDAGEAEVRVRILDAAFAAFQAKGYAATSTLEIATRARVSKRELYALVGNKEEMLAACITNRSRRFQVPTELPEPQDRAGLERLLAGFGAKLLGEVSDPSVVGVFRLAIAEAANAPEVARALDSIGRQAIRVAINGIMTRAVAAKLLDGDPAELAAEFGALLFRDLLMGLLLGVAARPSAKDAVAQAQRAATAFIALRTITS